MTTRRSFVSGSLMGLVLLLLAWAAPTVSYGQDKAEKIQRGFANMVGGVVEIPGCVTDMTRKHGPLMGYTVGFFKGIGMVPVRTLVGVYEFATFYVPCPANYEPVLKPATAFNYWDEE